MQISTAPVQMRDTSLVAMELVGDQLSKGFLFVPQFTEPIYRLWTSAWIATHLTMLEVVLAGSEDMCPCFL
jgi:hypothetical protein